MPAGQVGIPLLATLNMGREMGTYRCRYHGFQKQMRLLSENQLSMCLLTGGVGLPDVGYLNAEGPYTVNRTTKSLPPVPRIPMSEVPKS